MVLGVHFFSVLGGNDLVTALRTAYNYFDNNRTEKKRDRGGRSPLSCHPKCVNMLYLSRSLSLSVSGSLSLSLSLALSLCLCLWISLSLCLSLSSVCVCLSVCLSSSALIAVLLFTDGERIDKTAEREAVKNVIRMNAGPNATMFVFIAVMGMPHSQCERCDHTKIKIANFFSNLALVSK